MDSQKKRRSPKVATRKTFVALVKLERAGAFTAADAIRLGISQPTLSRLLARGSVNRVGRGFYIHRGTRLEPKYWPFAMACRKFGYRAVIGGRSALYYHGLLIREPKKIWVTVGHHQKTVSRQYRCLRTNANPTRGIEDRQLFRITNMERTLVECIRHFRKIGREIVQDALQKALSEKRTSEAKIIRMASELGLGKIVRARLTRFGGGGT